MNKQTLSEHAHKFNYHKLDYNLIWWEIKIQLIFALLALFPISIASDPTYACSTAIVDQITRCESAIIRR